MKKGRHRNIVKNKNDNENISTWIYKYCELFLKLHKVVQQGNKLESYARYELLKKLLSCSLENLISLSKTELKLMSAELILPFGAEISKDNLIKNVSNTIINK